MKNDANKEENKILEFNIAGCIFTGKEKVTLDILTDSFIEMVEQKGWEFCGSITPLEIEDSNN